LEQHQRPVRVAADPIRDRRRVERLLAQGHDAAALANGTTAHRWDHGQLVTILERVIPTRVLRVDRASERARKRTQVIARAELTPGIGGGRTGWQRQIDIGLPDQLARLSEKHDAHLHGVMISPLVWGTSEP